jgi:hypothetical protein
MVDDESPVTAIERRPAAQIKTLSYSDPVVLHDSSQSRITLVPFFIKHSDYDELAVKIVSHKKAAGGFVLVDDKSISLKEPAARHLLEALRKHFAVSEQGEDGSYIAIRVSKGGGVPSVAGMDSALVAQAVAALLQERDIVQNLLNQELSSSLLNAFRGAIRLQELTSALATLRQHLDAGVAEERVYQDWCEKHTWAFGNAYVVRDDVKTISSGDKLDLLLPSVLTGYRDIVELKRPDKEVLVFDQSHGNYYWATDASKAIGQCHRYLDVLHEEAANGLRDHPDIVAYHPRAIIVLGRSAHWPLDKSRCLHGLNSRMNGITVMTYDQLLAQGERLVAVVGTASSQRDEELYEDDEFPDEIPF